MPYVASTRAGLLGVDDERVRAAAMADVQSSLTALGERALRSVEALEVEKARLEARLLTAYGVLHTIEAQQVETSPSRPGSAPVRSPAACPSPPHRAGTGSSWRRYAPGRPRCTVRCRSRPRPPSSRTRR